MNTLDTASLAIKPKIGTLRVTGGVRVDAAPCAVALSAPANAARGRAGEVLFILIDVRGLASLHVYRELREVAAQTYWVSPGSITAALRQAALAVSRYLFQLNLHAAPSDRFYGNLICAVLHDGDLFILQAGLARACILHSGRLECYGGDEALPYLGMGTVADVRLFHAYVTAGDTLLLASSTLGERAGEGGFERVLPRADLQEILAGLEQLGSGADIAALVARLVLLDEAPAPRQAHVSHRPRAVSKRGREHVPDAALPDRGAGQRQAPASGPDMSRRERVPSGRMPRSRPALRTRWSGLGNRAKEGLAAAGRAFAALGARSVDAARMLFRRMLPGPEREAYRRVRARRPAPPDNRAVMIPVAIGIPVVVALIAVSAYMSFGREARLESLIHRAEQEIALAQLAADDPAEARTHWEEALDYAERAAEQRPGDPQIADLHGQAQAAIDGLDGVTRLGPIHLQELGSGAVSRLVVHGQMIFVLDPAAEWVIHLTLNPTGDGVVEAVLPSPLVRAGQQVGGTEVGDLVDIVWVGASGGRQTSGLVILEKGGALVSHDPLWGGEGGISHLQRSFLGTPPVEPRVVDTFEGRLYVLDPVDNNILRYEPQGDTYPGQPGYYFVTPPPKSLETALDLAIDGNVYILYEDGTILKFLGGEPQDFQLRGLPDGIEQAVGLAVDPEGSSGRVYMADRGGEGQAGGRVIVLESDGAFRAQLRADGAFDSLEALAVDEAARRLYVVSGGELYVAALP